MYDVDRNSQREHEKIEQMSQSIDTLMDKMKKLDIKKPDNILDRYKKPSQNRTMKNRLQYLSSRDLNAYMTRISQPKHIEKKHVPYSESYLNPNIVPNGCIKDSDV